MTERAMISDPQPTAATGPARDTSAPTAGPSGPADPPPSLWRRLLTRVAGWQAPPRNLFLSALVLLVFPWDDVLIDALYAGSPKFPVLLVYGGWGLFDFAVIWVLLASGRLMRPAFIYGAITVGIDVITAIIWIKLPQYSGAYIAADALLRVAYVALITVVMWVRLSDASEQTGWSARWLGLGGRALMVTANPPAAEADQATRTRATLPVFTFVIPLLVSIAVTYAATFFAGLTCVHRSPLCTAYGPPIGHAFFDQAAHILTILLVTLAIEARLLMAHSGREERAVVGVTILGLAVGIAAAMTATAADSATLPLVFPLTVQSLTIGVTTTVIVPFLSSGSTPSRPSNT
jgi:hypothetical protein